jgi:hypothetical protein
MIFRRNEDGGLEGLYAVSDTVTEIVDLMGKKPKCLIYSRDELSRNIREQLDAELAARHHLGLFTAVEVAAQGIDLPLDASTHHGSGVTDQDPGSHEITAEFVRDTNVFSQSGNNMSELPGTSDPREPGWWQATDSKWHPPHPYPTHGQMPSVPVSSGAPTTAEGVSDRQSETDETPFLPTTNVGARTWSWRQQPQQQPQQQQQQQPQPEADAIARRRHFPRGWRLTVATVAALVVVTLLGFLSANDSGTHDQLSKTRTALASTKRQLSASKSQLQQAQSQLSSTRKQINSLQGSVSNVQNAVGVQASVTGLLKTCLGGVSQALENVLNGHLKSGLLAIESVQGTCQKPTPAVNALGGVGG